MSQQKNPSGTGPGKADVGVRRRSPLILLKAAVTIGLIGWLLSRIDGAAVGDVLATSDILPIALALAVLSFVFVLACVRWWLLLGHVGVSLTLRRALPSYYLGQFFNNFLPTGVGGDVIRVWHLNLKGHSAKSLISSALADRVIGLAVMLLMGTISLMLSTDVHLSTENKITLVTTVTSAVAGGLLALRFSHRLPLERLQRRYQHTRVRRAVFDVIQLLLTYRTAIRPVLGALLLSVGVQSLVILTYYLLGSGIGIQLSLVSYFAFVSMVQLAASLPISIGGLGIREGALVALLGSAGVDIHLGAALSLLFLVTLWLCSLPGAVVMLLDRMRRGVPTRN